MHLTTLSLICLTRIWTRPFGKLSARCFEGGEPVEVESSRTACQTFLPDAITVLSNLLTGESGLNSILPRLLSGDVLGDEATPSDDAADDVVFAFRLSKMIVALHGVFEWQESCSKHSIYDELHERLGLIADVIKQDAQPVSSDPVEELRAHETN